MSYNGSGTFVINSTGQPVVTNTTISSTVFNALTADLATGLSTAICKDGQTTTTARVPFASGISTAAATPAILTNGQAVSIALTSQTVGATTLTIPDFASVVDEFTFKTKAQTMANKTLTNPVVSGTITGGSTMLSPITASLGADVALNNTGSFFDGPSVAQGSTGTWFASGQIVVTDTAGAATCIAKLWDGTTIIASQVLVSSGAGVRIVFSLAGFITSPAGNLRISVQDASSTSGGIRFNSSGSSKDSTITAIRIG